MKQWLRVFLSSDAGEVELSTKADDGFILNDGVRGFGVPDRSLESTPIPDGDGSVFRSQRFNESEMMLPITIRSGDEDEHATRCRLLERVCAVASDEPIEIRVEAPGLGTVRRRKCYYTEGLEGALGGNDSFTWWRKLQVKFKALDPYWLGQTRVIPQKVQPADKPFITGQQALQARTNLVLNPGVEYGRQGFFTFGGTTGQDLSTTNDAKSGQSALLVTAKTGSGTPHVVTPQSPVAPGAVYTVGFQVKASPLVSAVRVGFWQTNGPTFTNLGATSVFPVGTDWQRVVATSPVVGQKNLAVQVQLLTSQGGSLADAPAGEWIALDEFILEAGPEVGPYFDGDTPTEKGAVFAWTGAPGQSASTRTVTQTVPAIPFFPVILASSTIQGSYVLDVQGDAPAYPITTVTGPGKDLVLVQEDTGERLFIRGDFTEQVTIDSRPTVQDIYSDSSSDGSLWDRVGTKQGTTFVDSDLFALQPGANRVRMTMVNATPDSQVVFAYDERFWAAY